MDIYRYEFVSPEQKAQPDAAESAGPDNQYINLMVQAEVTALQEIESVHEAQHMEYALLNATYDEYFGS